MRTNRLATTAAALALTGLLTACGSMQPGTAAQIGGERLTTDQVDRLSLDFCEGVRPLLQGPVPMSLVRGAVVSNEIIRSIAEGIADEYDVQPTPGYQQTMQSLRAQAAEMEEAAGEAFVEVNAGGAYFQDILGQVAQQRLADQGVKEPQAEQMDEQFRTLISEWVRDNGLDIDPRYGMRMDNGQLVAADTGLSVATSDTAKRLNAEEPDPSWVSSLPETQRCG